MIAYITQRHLDELPYNKLLIKMKNPDDHDKTLEIVNAL